MIKLSARLRAEMQHHAEREYPHECCGLLIGRFEDNGQTRLIVEISPIENEFDRAALQELFNDKLQETDDEVATINPDERHHRMLIPPLAYLQAERQYAQRGLGVVGNYHSHPEHPAVPSQFDLEHLAPWPTMSYIVISVRQGRAVELRSWELAADRSRFKAEELLKGE
jgi:proteasome lid subunit RPN8/RPN11